LARRLDRGSLRTPETRQLAGSCSLRADGVGTGAIIAETGTAEVAVWRWAGAVRDPPRQGASAGPAAGGAGQGGSAVVVRTLVAAMTPEPRPHEAIT